MPTKYIFKANDDVLSFCKCDSQPAMSPGQLDCPWCGCGWLIACSKCTKSYTFAEVKETDLSLEELAHIHYKAYGNMETTESDISNWTEWMAHLLEPLSIGDKVVYMDGHYIPIDTENVKIEGIYAEHEFDKLPHAFSKDAEELRSYLGDPSYWFDRAIEAYDWLDENDPYELFQEAIEEVKNALEKSDEVPFDLQYFYRMIYTQIFSTIEAYLYDRIRQIIFINDKALELFCKNDEKIKAINYKAETVFKGRSALRESVIGSINGRVFHKFHDVVKYFESACDTKINIENELAELNKYVSKRHDCVHRNGKNVDGEIIIYPKVNYNN